MRKSVRSYTGEAPTDAELDLILKAAYAAPVGMGRYDSLHITVVQSGDFLARLETAAGAQLGKENYHPLYGAPVLMIFSSVFPGIPTDNSAYSNCAILAQNAALAAVSLGLGTCHIWGAIRALNESLAGIEVPEAAAKVLSVTESAADILNAYLSGFAGDGRIDGDELAAINAATDAAVDKYLTDETVDAALDKILG